MKPTLLSRTLSSCLLLALAGCGGSEVDSSPPETIAEVSPVVARGMSLELDTEYEPPPGEALHHYTAGFAKVLCSAVFLTGLDPEDAAANVGGFTSPFDQRQHVVDTIVDFERLEVRLTLRDGVTRSAKRYASQGCVAHAIGEDSLYYSPAQVSGHLPPTETTPWPMGDVLPNDPFPTEIDSHLLRRSSDREVVGAAVADRGTGRGDLGHGLGRLGARPRIASRPTLPGGAHAAASPREVTAVIEVGGSG